MIQARTNLYDAHKQWRDRPDDERFWSLDALKAQTRAYFARSVTARVPARSLRFESDSSGEEVLMRGESGSTARLSSSGMDAMARLAGAPSQFLRELSAPTAARVLDECTQRTNGGTATERELLFLERPADGELVLRGATGAGYRRVWNYEIAEALLQLEERGWRVPPARPAPHYRGEKRLAESTDVVDFGRSSPLSVKVGDEIAPAGIYASDSELFCFLVKPDAVVQTSGGALARGVMVWNGETGGTSIGISTFLLEYVCGNHIVWGASDVHEIRRAHTGDAREAWADCFRELARYSEADTSGETRAIERAREFKLGADVEEVVQRMYSSRLLPQRTAREAFELARERDFVGGDPCSAWGFAGGLTVLSQREQFADARLVLDRAAGRVLELVPR